MKVPQCGRLRARLADVASLLLLLLLLLVQDLELQELLLLLQETHVGRVQGRFVAGVLLLVGGHVLVVLELLHSRLGVFVALFAPVLRGGAGSGLALLRGAPGGNTCGGGRTNRYSGQEKSESPIQNVLGSNPRCLQCTCVATCAAFLSRIPHVYFFINAMHLIITASGPGLKCVLNSVIVTSEGPTGG